MEGLLLRGIRLTANYHTPEPFRADQFLTSAVTFVI